MSADPDSMAHLLLAVDAGGTKTIAGLAHCSPAVNPRILGCGNSSSGNPLSVGFEAALHAIAAAIAEARQAANQNEVPIARAVFSIAGAANPEIADRVIHWAKTQQLASQIAVVSDVLPILAAGTDALCGIALIAGTGSVTFGRNAAGHSLRCGGWGYLLGDDGSGYAIGRAALRYALESFEVNCKTKYPSRSAILPLLSAGTADELVKSIYSSANPRATIASLAAAVAQAADMGDPTCQAILDSAAIDLAMLVARTTNLLGFGTADFQLALAGGVLVGSQVLRDRLAAQLAVLNLNCETRLVTDPLAGCLKLADPNFGGDLIAWH